MAMEEHWLWAQELPSRLRGLLIIPLTITMVKCTQIYTSSPRHSPSIEVQRILTVIMSHEDCNVHESYRRRKQEWLNVCTRRVFFLKCPYAKLSMHKSTLSISSRMRECVFVGLCEIARVWQDRDLMGRVEQGTAMMSATRNKNLLW
jgi:hypothetical protein